MAVLVNKVPILGEAANSWLTQGGGGKVLAAVNHATYLLTEHGELIWLATPESPKHRRCILWPAPLPNLAVDSIFTTRDRSIDLESGTKLDFRTSEVWKAPVIPVQDIIELDILPYRFFTVVETFLSQESPPGVGVFVRLVLQIARKKEVNLSFQPGDFLTRSAWSVVERIARACLRHDPSEILKKAEALIGLGEGLTPAGDDFLGGLFFACFMLSCSYPYIHFRELDDLPEWVDAHQSRTNQISFALLRDNASGHALEPLNRFGIALLTNQPVEILTSAASDLIKVGHSTGWSLLAGYVTGMLLAFTD
jgi:hypothetical protein